MDRETWSIVLSVVGLLLGILSAQAQLKSMARWALKAGGERARAWVKRMNDDADLYASNTSALVSFIVKRVLSVIFVLSLVIPLIAVLRGDTFTAPLWVRQVIMVLGAMWVGNDLAAVSQMVEMTLRKARSKHAGDG